MTDIDVAVVGGGISGLSATRALAARGVAVRLFERNPTCGGLVRTDRIGGFVIDAGPETLLAHKPAALELVRELGLDSCLVAPFPARSTYVLRRSALRTLPETSALGLPTGIRTLIAARAFSWAGKLRMAVEPLIRGAAPDRDESIHAFVQRRFGPEAVTYVAEPVLAGIHRGDAGRLSMQALFPALANAERTHGSVARAWRRMPARPGGSGSMSLRGGLGQLVGRLQQQLPADVVVTGREVLALERTGGFALHLGDGSTVTARAVLLATPAHVTTTLLSRLDQDLAQLTSSIRYASSVNVALGYRREDIIHPLRGWGFVVPRHERRTISSASWVSSKWPGRAPEGHALVRVALGDGAAASPIQQPDHALIDRAHDELAPLLRITGPPVIARVYRHPRAMPQLEVGHLDRMAAIDRRLASVPGLFLSASGFRGIGLPDCISDARAAAERIAEYLQATPSVG
jgi:oxygen-dependent protoporphyrinogen oxidase